MEDLIIGKQFKYAPLVVQKLHHLAYEQKQPNYQYKMVAPSALIGIEVEVENVPNYISLDYYWKSKHDGSLRNNGCEFTSIPLRAYQVPYALDYLWKQMCQENDPDFSPRTSIHIHLNVRDMTVDQIKVLTLLYSIFERHFFHIAGTKREESIFCVPLYLSKQVQVIKDIPYSLQNWHKYNAVNLGTITGTADVPRFGTIEFRHLYGTMDNDIIINWINNILYLRQASLSYTFDELSDKVKDMNSTSEYIALYSTVFGEYANLPKMIKFDFEYCITQTKLALWGSLGSQKFPFSQESKYYTQATTKKDKGIKQPTPFTGFDELVAKPVFAEGT